MHYTHSGDSLHLWYAAVLPTLILYDPFSAENELCLGFHGITSVTKSEVMPVI